MGIALIVLITAPFAYADHSTEPVTTVATYESTATTHAAVDVGVDCTISVNLSGGQTGTEVACLQRELIEAGHLGITAPTGYFGAMTKAALMKWQKEKGIAATGFFGLLSREAFGHHETSPAMPAVHPHEPVDVSKWTTIPSVTIQVHKDAKSGYNLEITPVNFRFAPEHVNGVVMQNEGHTHLYINGKKITRVYGSWLHMAPELFADGVNEVVVTLNANDHNELALGGIRIEAKATVTK